MSTLKSEDFNKWLEKNPTTLSEIFQQERNKITKAIPTVFNSFEGFQLIYMVDPTCEDKILEIFLVVLSDTDLPHDTNLVTVNNMTKVNESKLTVSVSEPFIQVDQDFRTI